MKKNLVIFLFLLSKVVFSQTDFIVNVTGKFGPLALPVDTIVIENITNGDTLTLSPLPQEISTYEINLTQGKLINALEENDGKFSCELIQNSFSGSLISLFCPVRMHFTFSIFSMEGKLVGASNVIAEQGHTLIRIVAGSSPLYILTVSNSGSIKSFKLIGNPSVDDVSVQIVQSYGGSKETYGNGFNYSPGDELNMIAKKPGYYSGSTLTIPVDGDSIDIHISRPCPGIPVVTDYDGNTYHTVQIGNQCWLKEELRSKHYSDGTSLIDGTGVGYWHGDTISKYWFDYDDNPANSTVYGRLYSGAAVLNGCYHAGGDSVIVQGLCPTGWHVPNNHDWSELESYVGLPDYLINQLGWRGSEKGEGNALKEIGDRFWWLPKGKNLYGFSALGSGVKGSDGMFSFLQATTYYWSSTSMGSVFVHSRGLNADQDGIYHGDAYLFSGLPCRCIKDQ